MNQRLILRAACAAFIFTALPVLVLANAGTPLMWAGMFLLVFGNAVIGIGEGLIIGFFFKLKYRWSIPVMIVANYASAYAGANLISSIADNLDPTIYNVWLLLWCLVFLAFLLTLLIEWPFILFSFRKQPRPVVRSLKANLIVQTASYLLMIPYMAYFSYAGIVTKADLDPSLDFIQNREAILYYISNEDGDVYRQRLGEMEAVNVFEADSTDKNDRLLVWTPDEGKSWELYLRQGRHDESRAILIPESISLSPSPSMKWYREDKESPEEVDTTWFNFVTIDLRLDGESAWTVKTGFWAAGGLTLRNEDADERIHLAMETPFVTWYIRNATVLPGDEVVFQLNDQICIYDRESNKLGLLARGRGPVVVLGDTPTTASLALSAKAIPEATPEATPESQPAAGQTN